MILKFVTKESVCIWTAYDWVWVNLRSPDENCNPVLYFNPCKAYSESGSSLSWKASITKNVCISITWSNPTKTFPKIPNTAITNPVKARKVDQ